ncbi:uncharacterized protein LOC142407797 [Mycteria americana]|uniref:uncharacterized protein LOC142407797 n=1 Tax=Mycteria americana TaxID=33587 RepID=UPI003F584A6A
MPCLQVLEGARGPPRPLPPLLPSRPSPPPPSAPPAALTCSFRCRAAPRRLLRRRPGRRGWEGARGESVLPSLSAERHGEEDEERQPLPQPNAARRSRPAPARQGRWVTAAATAARALPGGPRAARRAAAGDDVKGERAAAAGRAEAAAPPYWGRAGKVGRPPRPGLPAGGSRLPAPRLLTGLRPGRQLWECRRRLAGLRGFGSPVSRPGPLRIVGVVNSVAEVQERTTERFGSEGTFKDHLSVPPAVGRDICH